MSHVPAGGGSNPSTTSPDQPSPQPSMRPNGNTTDEPPRTPLMNKVLTAIDGLFGSSLWALALVLLFESWPKEWGRTGMMFGVILFMVFTIRGANHLHNKYKNLIFRQGLMLDMAAKEVGFRGMLIAFLHKQMNILAENALLGRIREMLEHTPVDKVELVFESPEKLIIRLSGDGVMVDIDYNELVKDFEGTVNNAKEDFLDKHQSGD